MGPYLTQLAPTRVVRTNEMQTSRLTRRPPTADVRRYPAQLRTTIRRDLVKLRRKALTIRLQWRRKLGTGMKCHTDKQEKDEKTHLIDRMAQTYVIYLIQVSTQI